MEEKQLELPTFDFINIPLVADQLKELYEFLERGQSAGVFKLEESVKIYNILTNLTRVTKSLGTFQNFVKEDKKITFEKN